MEKPGQRLCAPDFPETGAYLEAVLLFLIPTQDVSSEPKPSNDGAKRVEKKLTANNALRGDIAEGMMQLR
ncbi:hypothetical protein [Brucella pituitosa]|uniref:hypothetical protein n=1 Tax=Brucella pituitosa TaxID=571256 RepID=UPI001260179A|nr:hypothetical protein [Brucella pituitosa]